MTELVKRLEYDDLIYGDIVRCTQAVRGSKGKRYKFTGAVFNPDDDGIPLYLDLIEIGRGQFRTVRPEFVVKEEAASRAAQARQSKKDAASKAAAQARQARKEAQ